MKEEISLRLFIEIRSQPSPVQQKEQVQVSKSRRWCEADFDLALYS